MINKKIIGIMVCLLFFGASILPSISGISNIIQKDRTNFNMNTINLPDQLDQYQQNRDAYVFITDNESMERRCAQSFTPELPTLTRIKLNFCKTGGMPENAEFQISIKIEGTLLASATKSQSEISFNPNFNWYEFDFPDITLTIGEKYFIVCEASGLETSNSAFFVGSRSDNPYTNGEAWVYNEGEWFQQDYDLCFETYGIPNSPPNLPTIYGPTSGKPDQLLTFTFNAVDPEGHDVRFIIDWGDGENETTSFTGSGTDKTAYHSWSEEGTYILTVKAEDEYGAIGDEIWGEINIKKKSKLFNASIMQFLQNHPNLFPLLQKLIEQLGL